jgi:hypothetical protein
MRGLNSRHVVCAGDDSSDHPEAARFPRAFATLTPSNAPSPVRNDPCVAELCTSALALREEKT